MKVKDFLENAHKIERLYDLEKSLENPDPIKLYDLFDKWENNTIQYELLKEMGCSDDYKITENNKLIFPKF